MDEHLRARARSRYAGRCGYCGVSEIDVGATLTIDHHCPRFHGGNDDDDNIVYACSRCNEHKGDYWFEANPPYIRLLHPRRDDLDAHVAFQEGGLANGLTQEGHFFIQRLRLNRPPLVAHRKRQQADARLEAERDALHEQVRELQTDIAELHRTLRATESEMDRENL